MDAWQELVTIGRVVKPQGRKGELLVEPLSDRPDRFPGLRHAFVPGESQPREVEVVSCWPHKGRFVLKLAGVDSIDAAEGFRGQELRIAEEALAPLPAGAFYHHQLVGLRAEDTQGHELGQVAFVGETGAVPVLVVRGLGGELMVPLAEPFVKRVSTTEGRIVLAPQGEDVC